MSKTQKHSKSEEHESDSKTDKLKKNFYFSELERLQLELVKLHEWVKAKDLRVVVLSLIHI